MKFKVQSHFPGSGMREDPGEIVDVSGGPDHIEGTDMQNLLRAIHDCMVNDYGEPFYIGHQVIITRIPD